MLPKKATTLMLLLAACAHSPSRATRAVSAPPPAEGVTMSGQAPAAPAQSAAASPTQGAREPLTTQATATEPPVDFARDIQPILAARCRPCHFPGGTMYDRRPFDRARTVRDLGTRLFTRIKAEDEQALIRRFLAQPD